MMLGLFNIFNLVSYKVCGCNILILCGQIYGPGLDRHGPTKPRRGLGLNWTTVFVF
jgi:hypothetical protein